MDLDAARRLTSETGRILLAMGRVLKDSNQTREIHVVEEITSRPRMRALYKQLTLSDPERLLSRRPELNAQSVDYDALAQLPAGTLGGAYARHLTGNQLSYELQASPTRFIDDPNIAYLVRRFRQTHDVWHVLTGLGVEAWEEVTIHAFSYGQLRLPLSVLVVALGGIKHLVLEGRWAALRTTIPRAYEAGRRALPLMPVVWEDRWARPLTDVRSEFGVVPIAAAA